MDSKPLVSVILPMFNSESFVEQSIQSIVNQSYENLECIVVDDGSSDRSWEIAESFQKKDSRIHLIHLEKNHGVAAASNIALQSASGKYIARMDADDISLKNRFLLQVNFMETHPDVGLLGGRVQYMSETGDLQGTPPIFQGDLSIRWQILFENPFFNPTVMFRKSIIDQGNLQYDTSAIYGEEDYDFLSRLLTLTKGENLSEILLNYRLHPSSLSYLYADERSKSVVNIASQTVDVMLPHLPISREDFADLQRAIRGTSVYDKHSRSRLLPVYLKLWNEFCHIHKNERDIPNLKREIIAWGARMTLYPPLQTGSLKALWLLTKNEWRWPFLLLGKLPYYLARRQI